MSTQRSSTPTSSCQVPSTETSEIDRMITLSDRRKLLSNSPTAPILIYEVPANCVLDTGAETSLISYAFYREHLAGKVGKLDDVGSYINLIERQMAWKYQ